MKISQSLFSIKCFIKFQTIGEKVWNYFRFRFDTVICFHCSCCLKTKIDSRWEHNVYKQNMGKYGLNEPDWTEPNKLNRKKLSLMCHKSQSDSTYLMGPKRTLYWELKPHDITTSREKSLPILTQLSPLRLTFILFLYF